MKNIREMRDEINQKRENKEKNKRWEMRNGEKRKRRK